MNNFAKKYDSVSAFLKEHPKILSHLQSKIKVVCDFETTTKENIKVLENGVRIAEIYSWGMSFFSKELPFVWGTELWDFWETILLITKNNVKIKDKQIYFHEFDFDYQFLKNYLFERYKWQNLEIKDFYEIKKDYLEKGNLEYEGYYNELVSGTKIIALSLLVNGCCITIKCSRRRLEQSADSLGEWLEKEGVPSVKKLSRDYVYELVGKPYKRNEFYNMVYGKYPSCASDFFKVEINEKSQYGYHVQYLHNDCKIVLDSINHFNKLLKKLELDFFKVRNPGIPVFNFGGTYYRLQKKVLNKITIFKKRKLKNKKIIQKTNRTMQFFQVRVIDIGLNVSKFRIRTKPKSSYEDVPIENREFIYETWTWLTQPEKKYLENKGFTFMNGDIETWKYAPIKKLFSLNYLTISGVAFEGLRNFFGKKNFEKRYGKPDENILSLKDYYLVNQAFQGGLTNFNKELRYSPSPVRSVDVISSYPHQMEKLNPYGKVILNPKKADIKADKLIGFIELEIDRFFKKPDSDQVDFFPKWKTKRNIKNQYTNHPDYEEYDNKRYLNKYYFGKFRTSFVIEEWEYIKKHYDIKYKVIREIYFKSDSKLKQYIDILKQVKQNASTKGLRLVGKLMMNGVYGKLAQKPISTYETVLDLHNLDHEELSKLNNENAFIDWDGKHKKVLSNSKLETLLEIKKDPSSVFKKEFVWLRYLDNDMRYAKITLNKPIEKEFLRYRHVGAHITWLARHHLMSGIQIIGVDRVRYYDTDSIYYNDDGRRHKLLMDDKKLGAWKNESKGYYMKIIGAKQYQISIKAKYKNNNEWDNYNYGEKFEYRIAGLSKANAFFNKVGHDQFKANNIFKNVNLKSYNLVSGRILDLVDFEMQEGDN